MGQYNEGEIDSFRSQNPQIGSNVRKHDDVYLSDFSNKTEKKYLTEVKPTINMDEFKQDLKYIPDTHKADFIRSAVDVDDSYRTNLSKAFGSDDEKIDLQKRLEETKKDNNIPGLIIGDKTSKILNLIAELRSLGFNDAEIKKEIMNL